MELVGGFDGFYEIGKWKEYHKNGQIYKVSLYEERDLIDINSCSNGHGNELDKGMIFNRNGTAQDYDTDSNLLKVHIYEDGSGKEE